VALEKRRELRVSFILWTLVFLLELLLARLFWIQCIRHEHFSHLARKQYRTEVELPAERGKIFDRYGRLLATSLPASSIYLDPCAATELEETAKALARALDLNEEHLTKFILQRKHRRFIWIKRKVTPEEGQTVKRLNLAGVGFRKEPQRFYPQGTLAAPLLGFAGLDGTGLSGLEAYFEETLKGKPGYKILLRDGKRKALDPGLPFKAPEHGSSIVLTIDAVIQQIVEEELARALEEWEPSGAVGIVLEPKSGHILAMASLPSFDPNNFARYPENNWVNRCVNYSFEPGSVIKPLIVAKALQEGLARPEDVFFCENGVYRIGSRIFHDHHPYGWLTLSEVVIKSSNVGMAKLGEAVGAERLYACFRAFGFGQKTNLPLPGEAAGILHPLNKWTSYSVTSVPIGQEIAVTPLQLALAFSAIANDGVLPEPRLVRAIICGEGKVINPISQGGKVILEPRIARIMRTEIMRRVVEEGTGSRARLSRWSIAGKTGTAQKAFAGGFSHTKFISSFVGMAPAEEPRAVVLVMIDEPHKGGIHYGGTVAAPVVASIFERILAYLQVAPEGVPLQMASY